ncbi:MAG: peptidase T [Candidatus Eisenbacteria bacterium]|uniref:Peptidase T n=1 Tax=Eiseniibacteriota bacterium TaxID=2212470 RepID=A0A948W5T2_UNCEI|nr:peptidase T [Candidatus Eisenbacteria bacterium]MBU1948488.1 peptidase T [Candidatus Eisenbacteria bacterium]MBU2689891.1 peptidase T [Candidatus Eisenbacteria bacterium]
MITDEMRRFYADDVRERFLRYVRVHTTSDEASETTPSTPCQFDLARMLEGELKEIGLQDVLCDAHSYTYGTLPAMKGCASAPPFGLLAHLDTSPDQPGENVIPVRHEAWDGSPIRFPDDPGLRLTETDAPELSRHAGETIITASGKTLLGADDKAGIAEIMAALATLQKFPELPHGAIRVCFTPDEEIGRGTVKLNLEKLPRYCYTMDGGAPGELEAECFDAWRADLNFKGAGVHPGYAKNKMINASTVAARFLAALPEWQTPEHTEGDEGFYHVTSISGDFENAEAGIIIRDFEESINLERIDYLKKTIEQFEKRYPGLKIDLKVRHQYRNMRDIIKEHPGVVETAVLAMENAGLKVHIKSIRGGTDGSALTQKGHPTPNIFTGGFLFHSRKEWIAESNLNRAVETILHLAACWSRKGD